MTMTASVPAPMYTTAPFRFVCRQATHDLPGRRTTRNEGSPGQRVPVYCSRLMSERERRIGENEAYWRQVNELSPPEPRRPQSHVLRVRPAPAVASVCR